MKLLRLFLIQLLFIGNAFAATIAINSPTTITFNQQLTKNYSEIYQFTLTDRTAVNYFINTHFDGCVKGCGNPKISYGIYDSFGKQIDTSGAIVLSSGTYTFGVKTTGMGSKNSVAYAGQMNFISPVPEPADYLLFFVGIILLAIAVVSRKQAII